MGQTVSGISGDKTEAQIGVNDYWIVKVNSTGTAIEWQRTLGGSANDIPSAIREDSDEGLIMIGKSSSGTSATKTDATNGSTDYWVVKLSSDGQTIEWDKSLGGSGNDSAEDIIQLADGGYLAGGWSTSGISGDKDEASQGSADYWLVKLETTGCKDETLDFEGLSGTYTDNEYLGTSEVLRTIRFP